MKIFDHRPAVVLPERSSMSVPNNTPEWITGIIIVAAIIGLFVYGSGSRTDPGAVTTPTHEMTQPPPVNPAPPPDAASGGDRSELIRRSMAARPAGVTRDTLYKALSKDGDLRLGALLGVTKALGSKIHVAT